MSDLYTISKTIMAQLKLNPMELFAWGSKDFLVIRPEINGIKYPGIMFTVSTPLIKRGGRVIVALDEARDTYIVQALRLFGDNETILGTIEDVYFDGLHEAINSLIETEDTIKQIIF